MAKATKATKAMLTTQETASTMTTGLDTLKKLGNSLSDEMNGLTVTFEKIGTPIGGVTYFEMPGEDPEKPATVKEFSAVILHHHIMRAYYKEKYTGGNNPPDCGSFDGVEGTGEPGGICENCACNKFGTGENGAKACKERRRLYLLLEGQMFPMVLSLPTSSLKDFSRHVMRCFAKWGKCSAGITRFSLVKAVNKGGIAYTKVHFRMERPLTEAELVKIEPMALNVKAISQTLTVETKTDMMKGNKNNEEAVPGSKTEVIVVEKDKGAVQTSFTLGAA